jgi:hypothetical protein
MNRAFAVVLHGSKAVILHEQPDAGPLDQVQFLAVDAFRIWNSDRFVTYTDAGGRQKTVTWAARWLADSRRRKYRGVEFHPDPDDAPGRNGFCNLWQGFTVTPRKGDWSLFYDHIYRTICRGVPENANWVVGWTAHMLQRPRERPGTALALRGVEGGGKTIFGRCIGRLLGRHYILVDTPRYIVGNFNAHMARCLLLQADEGFWAGDKAAEGRLKGLITAETQMIEPKGIDAIEVANYLRLLVTANADWAIPAGLRARRWCILDVGDAHAGDIPYFRAIVAQMENGGYEAMLHDLLAFDLDQVDLRAAPPTEALLEQKIFSFDPIEKWWFGRLMAGTPTRKHKDWPGLVIKERLFDDYVEHSNQIGINRKGSDTEVGIKLRKLVEGLGDRRETVFDEALGHARRAYCYVLPPLAACRASFAKQLGQTVAWPAD